MRIETAKLMHDVLTACDLVRKFTLGKSFSEFESEVMLRAAVEREFIIVGEALTQARKFDPESVASITAVVKIIGFRNVLVHGYGIVEPAVVWSVIERDLERLTREVQALLATAAPLGSASTTQFCFAYSLSQAELVQKSGVAKSTIGDLASGKRKFTVDHRKRIAAVFNLSASLFLPD